MRQETILITVILCLLIVIIAVVIGMVRRRRRRSGTVARIKDYKKSTKSMQPCSLCRKKVKWLRFYSTGDGNKVIGVCADCRVQAEKMNMMEL